ELDKYHEDGEPLSLGWFMYQGNEVTRPAVAAYVNILQTGFVTPVKQKLEARLKLVKGNEYLKERTELKTYLMLSDIEHLDVELETGVLTSIWAEMLRPTSSIAESDLKKKIVGHVRYYLTLLKTKRVAPVPPNEALVNNARKTLQA